MIKPLINRDKPVIELLFKNGCKNEYCEEIYVEKDQVVKKLSPLIIACSEGDLYMVKFLFNHA